MRLLVPTRICLALRWATTPAASRVTKREPKQSNKADAALGQTTAQPDAPPAPSEVVKRVPKPNIKATLRETTAQRAALAYLNAGKNEEFRAQWKGKLLGGEMSNNAALHEALLRSAESGKSDPAMLRWYAESLDGEQRAPFPANPHFDSIMVPVVSALGGKIEKWEQDDKRKEKLRKWRDDYANEALENLLESMLDYMSKLTEKKKFTASNLLLLKKALERVKRQDRTVAVNWSDIVYRGTAGSMNFENLLPRHSLLQVGRGAESKDLQFCDFDPLHICDENNRLMENPSQVKGTMKLDGLCTLLLAVASRGHWLTNGKVDHDTTWDFGHYITRKYKGDSSQAKLLRNFANDSVLRYSNSGVVQPAVDHSRAPQFIDQDKKELAFTVSRDIEDTEDPPKHPYKSIEYYSLHLD